MKYFDRFGNNISSRKWLELFRDPDYSIIDSFALGTVGADLTWVGVYLPFFEAKPKLFVVRTWEILYAATDGGESGRASMTYHWFGTEDEAEQHIHALRKDALAKLEEQAGEDHEAAA